MLASDCQAVLEQGFTSSGVYQIQPFGSRQFESVYCEMINQTGWTVFQRRESGQISFDREWVQYQYGFGSLYGEFWLGNEV